MDEVARIAACDRLGRCRPPGARRRSLETAPRGTIRVESSRRRGATPRRTRTPPRLGAPMPCAPEHRRSRAASAWRDRRRTRHLEPSTRARTQVKAVRGLAPSNHRSDRDPVRPGETSAKRVSRLPSLDPALPGTVARESAARSEAPQGVDVQRSVGRRDPRRSAAFPWSATCSVPSPCDSRASSLRRSSAVARARASPHLELMLRPRPLSTTRAQTHH